MRATKSLRIKSRGTSACFITTTKVVFDSLFPTATSHAQSFHRLAAGHCFRQHFLLPVAISAQGRPRANHLPLVYSLAYRKSVRRGAIFLAFARMAKSGG